MEKRRKKTLNLEQEIGLDTLLAAMQPDSHGLAFLPALAGERSPGWRGGLRGVIAGLSLSTTPLDILRSALEGTAYRISLIYSLLEPFLEDEYTVIVGGGALINSPVWVQIIADVLGHPVLLSCVEEASARGAAMLAFWRLGLVPGLDAFPSITGGEFAPNPENYEIYQRAMQCQRRPYESVL